jgi:hypothetical protein
MKKIIKKNKSGIALIELLVSVTIFVVLMISITQIFQMVMLAQRQVIAVQNVQESLKYFFEVTSKEIRMSKRNPALNGCSNIASGRLYSVVGDSTLYLRNHRDECVRYFLSEGRFQVERRGQSVPLTPAIIEVKDLRFIVNEMAGEQAYITISILAENIGRDDEFSEILMQTTVASRYYRSD